jgi:hypothetical protein
MRQPGRRSIIFFDSVRSGFFSAGMPTHKENNYGRAPYFLKSGAPCFSNVYASAA